MSQTLTSDQKWILFLIEDAKQLRPSDAEQNDECVKLHAMGLLSYANGWYRLTEAGWAESQKEAVPGLVPAPASAAPVGSGQKPAPSALAQRINQLKREKAVATDWPTRDAKQAEIDALRSQLASCTQPPAGWACSRTAGHEGPCAARRAAA